MNNQLITPTEYEALPVEEKECYRLVIRANKTSGYSPAIFKSEFYVDDADLMYAPIIPIKEDITVTRFTMSEDLILKKNDVVAAVFCDHELATEVINYLNRK